MLSGVSTAKLVMPKATIVLLLTIMLAACQPAVVPKFELSELTPADGLTNKRVSNITFIHPGRDVKAREKLNYWTGLSLFRNPWVVAPSSTTDRDGLGPLFNTRGCGSCHQSGSRGIVPDVGTHISSSLVMRLSVKDGYTAKPHPIYGEQIQGRSISPSLPPEAKVFMQYLEIDGQYGDEKTYQLRQPSYTLTDLGYGDIDEKYGVSPRYAPNIYGMGLLDAIAIDDLLTQEDPSDSNGDGISGRYNRVPNVVTGNIAIGRFGFKAKHPTLQQQVAAAFRDDVGISNTLFPAPPCGDLQQQCFEVDRKTQHPEVEITPELMDLVMSFSQYIGVPPTRGLDQKVSQKGREQFYKAGCQGCHRPSYVTRTDYPVTALQQQQIWPYTDLALHDMGDGLADHTQEFSATGREWRTPPLWGIGLQKKITPKSGFLHDGRARTIEEAILWHGGEASASVEQFKQFSVEERKQLLTFLNAI